MVAPPPVRTGGTKRDNIYKFSRLIPPPLPGSRRHPDHPFSTASPIPTATPPSKPPSNVLS